MDKYSIFCVALATMVLFSNCNVKVNAQFGQLDAATITSILSMPLEDKLNLLKAVLLGSPTILQTLQDFLLKVLNFDVPPNLLLSDMVPWVFGKLPNALENKEFFGILDIVIKDLEKSYKPEYSLHSGNSTVDRNYLMAKLLANLDYLGMVQDIFTMRSVRDFFRYSSTNRTLNGKCYNDTMGMFDSLFTGQDWALDMLDAVGKPSAGIKRGVLYFVGNYDQCKSTVAKIPANTSLGEFQSADDVTFKGRYCRSTFNLPQGLINSVAGKHANNTYGIPLTLSWGMCLPDSCHAEDIEGLLNLGILGSLFNVSLAEAVCTEDLDFKNDKSSIAVTGVIGALGFIVLLCSVIELFCLRRTKHKDAESINGINGIAGIPYINHAYENNVNDSNEARMPGELKSEMTEMKHGTKMDVELQPEMTNRKYGMHAPSKQIADENRSVDSDRTEDALAIDKEETEGVSTKLLRAFSVFTNAPAVVSCETKQDDIPCLYGIRFISMLWVMLGNTYIYVALSLSETPVAVNLMDSFDIMKRFTFQVILSATFATDTFFVISGCLTAYWYLTKTEDSGLNINIKTWVKFYAGKYWKITPPYMLVLATYSFLYIYLGEGPMWPRSLNVCDKCHTDWWRHLLYVNNLVGVDGVDAIDQCMAWSWYLAVTMQFYLIAPILLTFISFSTSLGLVLVFILGIAGIVSAGIKESTYGGDILTTRTDQGAYWNNVFITPWCRVATFCIGIALGVILKKWSHKKCNKLVAAGLWLLSVCLAVLVIYCSYSKFDDNARPWSSADMAAYEALSRPVWGLCVAWVVYACSASLAGPISDFLSWEGFIPLSRLTFMAYLVHPVLMVLVTYTKRSLVYINDFEMAYLFIGHAVVSYGVAFGATLIFDMPFQNIKRILSGKPLEKQHKTVL